MFPECKRTNVNQMRNLQKTGLKDLENQMEQAEFASCHLIKIETAIDSLFLKENDNMKVWKIATELKLQNAFYH